MLINEQCMVVVHHAEGKPFVSTNIVYMSSHGKILAFGWHTDALIFT